MLTLPYLMALHDLCLNFKILNVEYKEPLIRVFLQNVLTNEIKKLECLVSKELMLVARQTHLSNALMSIPEVGYKPIEAKDDTYCTAQVLMEDLLSEHIGSAVLTRDKDKHAWTVSYQFLNKKRQFTVNSQLSSTVLLRLHQAAFYLRRGYQIEEEIGYGYKITSPQGKETVIFSKECNCREFVIELKQKAPCKHLVLCEVFTQWRHYLTQER